MPQDFTYAVARIRFKETRLLSDGDLAQLLNAKDIPTVTRLLRDKGWGDGSDMTPDELLRCEDDKTWAFIDELVPERAVFDYLLVPNDFHNLKVIIKAITRDIDPTPYFLYNALNDPEKLYDLLKRREYGEIPAYLSVPAKEALTVLLQTADGQLCDLIIDRACMEYVYSLGKANEDEIIRLYCELFVASADIKFAVRCAKVKKNREFILRGLAPCETLDVNRLSGAAAAGFQDIIAYLNETQYRSAVEAIETSMSAFEKWCDDSLTAVMKPMKWEPFSIGPVVAYIIARDHEIKAVRMILSGKLSELPEETIKERLRMMYV
jgi:V/A-type H+-transporting ATPase subunit C